MSQSGSFAPFRDRMSNEGLPDLLIDHFARTYERLVQGATGLIPETELSPVQDLPSLEALDDRLGRLGSERRVETVVIKLNGGLGTSMGLGQAKSLLTVRDGLTFLDIICRQSLASRVPVVLMNSFSTQADSLEVLKRYPSVDGRLERTFLQHKVPKIRQDDLTPVSWLKQPELEWCPPGHGDLYTAMVTQGILESVLRAGYRYAFVSNSDNLGAVLDDRILGFLAENGVPFLMEVASRSEADKKGGHLARSKDGRLLLREFSQCPANDQGAFQDIRRYGYFNTNNLWLDLEALRDLMRTRDNWLGLPMIRNVKTVDPRDNTSPAVYQLETAMGSAISVFEGAQAVHVPRSRFAPVKTTDDLLAVRSDAYVLTENYVIAPNPGRRLPPPLVSLESSFYSMIADFESRFPYGAPSLLDCRRLEVRGDFRFGRGVVIKGEARLVNESGKQVLVPDGSIIEGIEGYRRHP